MSRIEEVKTLLRRFEQEKNTRADSVTARQKCQMCAQYSTGLTAFEALFDFSRFDSMLCRLSGVKRQLAYQNTKVLLARRRLYFDVVYYNMEFRMNQSIQIARFATDNQALASQLSDRQETIRRLQQHLDSLRLENDAIARSSPSASARQSQIVYYGSKTPYDHQSQLEESLSAVSSDSAQMLKPDSSCAYERSPPSHSIKSDQQSPNSQEFRKLCQIKGASSGHFTAQTVLRASQPLTPADDQQMHAYGGSLEASPRFEPTGKAARIEDIQLDFDDF